MEKINASMIRHAWQVAEEIEANAVLVYVDVVQSKENLELLLRGNHCILAVRDKSILDEIKSFDGIHERVIRVPYMKLSRHSQVKVAAMIAISKGLIHRKDRIVCLSGSPEYGILDNLAVLDLEREFELFSSSSMDITDQMAQPAVFERLLTLVLELAVEGKEGRPLGTVFVLGDHEKVMSMSSQMVINPFSAVPEIQRNILDPALKETLREFSTIDGAFIVRDDGVIMAAGRHLAPSVEISKLPQGLGARHRSAAGITALTNAIAVVISESTGDVLIFSRGKLYLVGESGCGKSTIARAIVALQKPKTGEILYHGMALSHCSARRLRRLRPEIQMIFQDAAASLNPGRKIGKTIEEPLRVLRRADGQERSRRARDMMQSVGLDPDRMYSRYPFEFSGGQCQRVSLARALILNPRLLFCDEPVSSLDVSVQAQILNLLEMIKKRFNLTMLFISHDLAVVKNISDRVAVMYLGRICEIAAAEDLYHSPLHPYSAMLLSSVPEVYQEKEKSITGKAAYEMPSPADPPAGCRFHTRCLKAQDVCSQVEPELEALTRDRVVACHFPL